MIEINKGNLTSIATWIYILISPILVEYGYSIDQTMFVGAFVGIVGLALAIYSSANPNDMEILGNKVKVVDPVTDNGILNDEYVAGEYDDI